MFTRSLSLVSRSVSAAPALRQYSVAAAAAAGEVSLPSLGYAYDALEPHVSAEIMTIHHSKHHQTYVTNANVALKKHAEAEAKGDVASMIGLHGAIKFNGGGHVNHSLFWKNLAPKSAGGGDVSKAPELSAAINAKWGSMDAFQAEFNAQTAAVQGSGWGWLAWDAKAKGLTIVACPNQDPCSTTGTTPVIGIDVWEHAYYLQYKNVRPDYLKAIWEVVDFGEAEARFLAAK